MSREGKGPSVGTLKEKLSEYLYRTIAETQDQNRPSSFGNVSVAQHRYWWLAFYFYRFTMENQGEAGPQPI